MAGVVMEEVIAMGVLEETGENLKAVRLESEGSRASPDVVQLSAWLRRLWWPV